MGIKNKNSRHRVGDMVMFPMSDGRKLSYDCGIIVSASEDGIFRVKWLSGYEKDYGYNEICAFKTHFQSASKGY